MANETIGIIGKGNVGQALQRGLSKAGHEVRTTGKEPDKVREVGAWADVVVLAVPYAERRNALRDLGDGIAGKPLVDVTNAVAGDMDFQGRTDHSGAEELQELAPRGTRVVKAFNTAFAHHMDKGLAQGEVLTAFVASDDAAARQLVLGLARELGFDPVDAGPLQTARFLESLAYLNMTLAFKLGLGAESGFRYLHPATPKRGTRPAKSAPRRRRKETLPRPSQR